MVNLDTEASFTEWHHSNDVSFLLHIWTVGHASCNAKFDFVSTFTEVNRNWKRKLYCM